MIVEKDMAVNWQNKVASKDTWKQTNFDFFCKKKKKFILFPVS